MAEIVNIPADLIRPCPNNPRRKISRDELDELARSIAAVGLLQPISVRQQSYVVDEENYDVWYEIVCGHRRYEAAKMSGMQEIPCIVRSLSDDEAYEIMVTENLQRKDVDPFDESDAYHALRRRGYDTATLASKFGKSDAYILSRMKLGSLIPALRRKYDDGVCDFSHCLVLARLDEDFQQKLLLRYEDADRYDTLVGKTVKELRWALKNLGRLIGKAPFDTSACARCPKNTACDALFEDLDAICEDAQCYGRKTVEYALAQFEIARKRNPDFFIVDNYCLKNLGNNVQEEIVAELRNRGFAFRECISWKHERLSSTNENAYALGDITPVAYSFSYAEGWLGEEMEQGGESTEKKKYIDTGGLDWRVKTWEGRYVSEKMDIIQERIGKMTDMDLLSNSLITPDTAIRSALAYIVACSDISITACGLSGAMENIEDAVENLTFSDAYFALAKFSTALLQTGDDTRFARLMFPDKFVVSADVMRRSMLDQARACWHGYDEGEVTDDIVEAELKERFSKLGKTYEL